MWRTITEGNTQNSVHTKYKEIKAINSHKDCAVLAISNNQRVIFNAPLWVKHDKLNCQIWNRSALEKRSDFYTTFFN